MKGKIVAGILATLLMVNILLFAIPIAQADPDTIKIGIIGPVGLPHWSPAGMKEAAEMARDEINLAGGIELSDGNHTIALAFANEYALPVPDPDSAKAEMERLVDIEGCKTIIGGFRTEVTAALIETAADLGVQFLINGAATDELMDETAGNTTGEYERYKYIFRINPVKATVLGLTMGGFLQALVGTKMIGVYANPQYHDVGGAYHSGPIYAQVPIAVLVEDLAWTAATYYKFTTPAIYPRIFGDYINVTFADKIPESATDMSYWLDQIEAKKCAIALVVFSGRAGLPLAKQWGERVEAGTMDALMFGINVFGQTEDHWVQTEGLCNLESFLAFSGTRTPIITTGNSGATVDFWDNFVAKTGVWPIYTAWGTYDGIRGFKDTLEAYNTHTSSLDIDNATNPDDLVTIYENPPMQMPYRVGLSGKFKFTTVSDEYIYANIPGSSYADGVAWPRRHDVFVHPLELSYTWNVTQLDAGFVRAMIAQWQDGEQEVCSPFYNDYAGDFLHYAKKFLLNPVSYPTGYESMAETDTVCHPAIPYGDALFSVDGVIDGKDIGMATGGFWLSYPGHPGWNFNADLDDNELIDIVDVAIIASDWLDNIQAQLPLPK